MAKKKEKQESQAQEAQTVEVRDAEEVAKTQQTKKETLVDKFVGLVIEKFNIRPGFCSACGAEAEHVEGYYNSIVAYCPKCNLVTAVFPSQRQFRQMVKPKFAKSWDVNSVRRYRAFFKIEGQGMVIYRAQGLVDWASHEPIPEK